MADRRFVWTLVVLAIVARAAAVLALQSHKVPNSTYEHGTIAANLLAADPSLTSMLTAELIGEAPATPPKTKRRRKASTAAKAAKKAAAAAK